MNPIFKKWLDLGWDLKRKLPCPSCGERAIDFQHVGDPATRIGYLDIWCASCLKGIHISRVTIPEDTPLLAIKDDAEKIAARIPTFTWILPDD
jgi:hypothetical protein